MARQNLAYDKEDEREGGTGFHAKTLETYELLEHLQEEENLFNDDVFGEVLGELSGLIQQPTWCEFDPYGMREHEILRIGWENFVDWCRENPHLVEPEEQPWPDDWEEDEGTPLGQWRKELLSIFIDVHSQQLQAQTNDKAVLGPLSSTLPLSFPPTVSAPHERPLLREIPVGALICRVRCANPSEIFKTASQLGTAPKGSGGGNRWSDKGDPLFYGASDFQTCLAEVKGHVSEKEAWGAKFRTRRPLVILDLAQLPEIPSLFDDERVFLRSALKFLHMFAAEARKPIPPDFEDAVRQLEYRPTQVVALFLRNHLKNVDGIVFRSAAPEATAMGESYVLFLPHSACGEENDTNDEIVLELVEATVEKFSL